MEVRDKQKTQSKTVDLLNRESVNGELLDTSRLLEDVLERDNMLQAMYRVIRNKGSHGVDGTYKPSPGRSQHQAIKQSLEYINQWYKWVVDMDLEKFFDKVNHDILIDRLCKKNRR